MKDDERSRLDQIAADTSYARGVNTAAVRYCFQIVSRYLEGETLLELGPAEGVMTELLATTGLTLTLVEGSQRLAEDLQRRFPEARVENKLFEEFQPSGTFHNILLGHVLEHVEDPVGLIRRAGEWLDPDRGCIFAAVPNARSIHRQAAVLMDLLPSEDALNMSDIRHGHRRVFTPRTLRDVFDQAGLVIEVFGGYWLKPLANRQIEESWTPQMIASFMALGERYPNIAGEIYIVASRGRKVD